MSARCWPAGLLAGLLLALAAVAAVPPDRPPAESPLDRLDPAQLPAEARVVSDKELLTMILQNLVGNAIKYAPRRPVSITAGRDGAERPWRVSVSDQGPGIDPNTLAQMFQPFSRAITSAPSSRSPASSTASFRRNFSPELVTT